MEGDYWARSEDEEGGDSPVAVDAAALFAPHSEEEEEDISSFGSASWPESGSDSELVLADEDLWGTAGFDIAASLPPRGAPAAAAAAAPIPVPPAGVQPSAKRRRQAADSAGVAAKIDPARRAESTLSHETAYRWLQDPAVKACGNRPPFLRDVVHVEGRIYKEQLPQDRRAQGTDSWTVKGGPKGGSLKQVGASAWVKRAYGAQACQHL